MSDTKTRVLPSPGIGPDNEAFIAAAKEGRFVLRGCDDCGRTHWYPRAVCPHCASTTTTWKDASGRGTIYAFSTMLRVDPPYTLAYVTLDEGPTMMTNLVGAAPDAWRIGMKVQVRFQVSDDGTLVPVFAPA
jgi:uncharacterized OB-fold protein